MDNVVTSSFDASTELTHGLDFDLEHCKARNGTPIVTVTESMSYPGTTYQWGSSRSHEPKTAGVSMKPVSKVPARTAGALALGTMTLDDIIQYYQNV